MKIERKYSFSFNNSYPIRELQLYFYVILMWYIIWQPEATDSQYNENYLFNCSYLSIIILILKITCYNPLGTGLLEFQLKRKDMQ